MPTGVVTSARTKLFIAGVHADATDSAAEYAALTWVEIGDVVTYGEFGASYEEILHQPVSDGNTYKFKGTRNDGTLALNLGRAPADAGQAVLVTALDDYDAYDFKIELNDDTGNTGSAPTRFYFPARVMSYTTNVQGSNNVIAATCNVSINGRILEVAKVVGTP